MIGGGYATGRELVEFFMPAGPLGGILGLLVAGCVLAITMGAVYEFARITGARDYRSFCRELLGPGWILYELAYLALVILILAVIGAAAGELVESATGLPALVGTLGMMLLVGLLTFFGSSTIATVLTLWSGLLYLTYIVLFLFTLSSFGDVIGENLSQHPVGEGWAVSGLRYASYNNTMPAVLFCMVFVHTRRQAFGAGLITGLLAVIPALLFFLAMLSKYPEIGEAPVPALALMAQLNKPWLEILFQVVVFGTFVETGAGLLHAINERIAKQAGEHAHSLPQWVRPAVALGMLLLSVFGATAIGIIDLIARGYGLLSWVFIVVLMIPLLTLGVWRIYRESGDNKARL